MKLAEALKLRADLDERIGQLGARLNMNARVQEGDDPSEGPAELLAELDRTVAELEDLVYRINITNSVTESADGECITLLLARRDMMMRKRSVLGSLASRAGERADRYSRSEVMVRSTVDVRALRRACDDLSAEIRRTDNTIQELNWTTELV